METQVAVDQSNLLTRKAIAKNRLNDNGLADAVRLYSELLRDYPEDIDSLLTLGNLYLAVGDGKSARDLYKQAEKLNPNSRVIQCQLQLTSGSACAGDPELPPTHPLAIARLIRGLTGAKQESEEQELTQAAQLLETIIDSENPAEMVAKHIDEIDHLLPALVELNIRQAWSDGKPELVETLQALKQKMTSNFDEGITTSNQNASSISQSPAQHRTPTGIRVLLLKNTGSGLSDRMAIVEVALSTLGCEVMTQAEYNPARDPKPDVAIIGNPHTNTKLLENMATLSGSRVPVIVDLDDNFEQMPVSHTNYASAGFGTQAHFKAYNTSLLLADLITVNSEAVATSLINKEFNVQVIPDGWNSENPFWFDSNSRHDTINLGWISKMGQLEDLSLIRRVITRIIREFNNTQILVIGDSQAYRLFESIPENRRNYLPLLSSQEYPYQLGQIDILLVPLRNDPYHLSISDKILVEASAKGIPWIASPNLSFVKWQAGGLIANTQDEWYVYLRQMVMNADIRQSFAQSGQIASKGRETARVGEYWLQAVRGLLKAKKS